MADTALVLTANATNDTQNVVVDLHYVGYDGTTFRAHTDTITRSDTRYGAFAPGDVFQQDVFLHRVSETRALLYLTSPPDFTAVTYKFFAVVVVDPAALSFTIGNFMPVYNWMIGSASNDQISPLDVEGSGVQVVDDTHVILGGFTADSNPIESAFICLDVSGVTPSVAWSTPAAGFTGGINITCGSGPVLVGVGFSVADSTNMVFTATVDLVAHTVTIGDLLDPVANPFYGPTSGTTSVQPFPGQLSTIPLDVHHWLAASSFYDFDATVEQRYPALFYTMDSSVPVVSSIALLGYYSQDDGNTGAASRMARGGFWVLTSLQSDGPTQNITLVKLAIDPDSASPQILGIDARIVLSTSEDTEVAFSSGWSPDLLDAGNGWVCAWTEYVSADNSLSFKAAVVADDTTVLAVLDLDQTTPPANASPTYAVVMSAGSASPPTVESISAAGLGEVIETTTTSQSGPGAPKMAVFDGATRLGAVVDLTGEQKTRLLHEQHMSNYLRLSPALVVYGRPVNEPLLAGVSRSSGSITTADVSEELAAALDVNLGATWRWLPGPDFHASGADYVWDPISGSRQWTFPGANAPYLDPAFSLPTNHGDRDKPVLVFPGGAYGQLPVDPHAQFTVAIVARLLHPFTSHYYDLISSPSAATDPTKGTDLTLRYRGGRLRAFVDGKRYTDYEPEQLLNRSIYRRNVRRGRAAVIMVWSVNQTHLRFGVIAARSRHISKHRLSSTPGSFDLNFFLGRNGAAYSPNSTAHMQLLEAAVWRDDALERRGIRHVLHKLNGVYGVHQR